MFKHILLRLHKCEKIILSPQFCKQTVAYSTVMTEQYFKGRLNNHNAIVVNSTEESCEIDKLPNKLTASLKEWIKSERNAVWFEVNRHDADWIPILVKCNFKFHHTKEDKLTLYKWLRKDTICNIPHYAHTNIGIGAFVFDKDTGKLIVVKEKGYKHQSWKLPGGYIEPNENFDEAVEREVLEETGITAKFKCILGFRHTHKHAFDCSDIYFVAYLVPQSFDIEKSEQEISECLWMDLAEYVKHPEVHKNNQFIAQKMLEHLNSGIGINALYDIHPITKKPIALYSIGNNN